MSTHTITVKGMDANHNVLATDTYVIEARLSVVGAGYSSYSSHFEDQVGYAIVYDLIGGSWSQRGGLISPRESGTHTHSSGDTHTHDGWAIGNLLHFSNDGNIVVGTSRSDSPVVGMDGGSNYGYMQAFKWNGSSWQKHGRKVNHPYLESGGTGSKRERSFFGRASAVNADCTIVAVSAYQINDANVDVGDITVYQWNGNDWGIRQQDIKSQTYVDAYNGYQLAMDASGDMFVTVNGNKFQDAPIIEVWEWGGSGSSAYYTKTATLPETGLWGTIPSGPFADAMLEQDNLAPSAYGNAHTSVDITPSGDTILVKTSKDLQVFHKVGSNWVKKGQKLRKHREDFRVHEFCQYIAMSPDGNTIAMRTMKNWYEYYHINGGTGEYSTANEDKEGVVEIYDYNATNEQWELNRGAIYPPAGFTNPFVSSYPMWGNAISLRDNNTLVIGIGLEPNDWEIKKPSETGSYATSKGGVYAFQWDGTSWAQISDMMPGRNEEGAEFGSSVRVTT